MTDKIDKNQNISKNNHTSRQERRNIRIRERKEAKLNHKNTQEISQDTNIKNDTVISDNPQENNHKNQLIEEEKEQVQEKTVSKNEEKKLQINENTTSKSEEKIRTPSRESLLDRQFVNRKKRRERHEKRKQELLQGALKKLKTFSDNEAENLKVLEHSLGTDKTHHATEPKIQTSLSEKDILASGTPKEATQSESPKAQSAKDRFKNALKKISNIIGTDTQASHAVQTSFESPQELAFKKKLQERNRIKKMVTEYLENMGLSYPQGNFQILCNNMTDTLLLSLEAVPQKNKRRIEQLVQRAERPIRSGNNVLNLKSKKTKASEIVGDLFSRYDIDSKKDKIILKSVKPSEHIKLPKDTFDDLREDLLTYALLDMSDIQNFIVQNFAQEHIKDKNTQNKENNTEQLTDQGIGIQANAPVHYPQTDKVLFSQENTQHNMKHHSPAALNIKLKDLIQKNSQDTMNNLSKLKARLQK